MLTIRALVDVARGSGVPCWASRPTISVSQPLPHLVVYNIYFFGKVSP